MEIASELKMHLGNARRSAQTVTGFKWPTWLLALAFLAVFAAGLYVGGSASAVAERRLVPMAAANFRFGEEQQIARGVAEAREIAAARVYDQFVADAAERGDMPYWWHLRMSVGTRWLNFWRDGKLPHIESNFVTRNAQTIAEQRLKSSIAPQPETFAELQKRGMQTQAFATLVSLREPAALNYSKVLGRPVRAEQLITDADLRQAIRHADAYRASLGLKSY